MKAIPAIVACLVSVVPLMAEEEEKPIVAIYDLEGLISESGQSDPSLLGGLEMDSARPLTLFDITRSLGDAAADPRVKAIVLDVDDAALGLSQIQEIRRRLLSARAAGKDVWLYSDAYTNATALLGSAANHFTLMPEGDVSFSGIHAESLYFKGLLDKAGVVADVIHIGDFKSFGEEFYRTGPSDFARSQQEELINGIFEQIVSQVAEGRKVEPKKVRAMVDLGTFTASAAKEAGLVDALSHRTDFSKAVKAAYEGAEIDHRYALPDLDGPEIEGIFDLFKLMFQDEEAKGGKRDYLAVVALEGEISNESIAPVRAEILSLLKDERAKGLVLRVDSPGGSALASEVLWEATDEWKAAGRPFVVSMGEVAASGGYYVASGADRIFAEEGTVTGSIGVVGMKFVLGGAMEKLGISSHSTQRGKNAGADSMFRPFTADESKRVRESMLQVYGTFKKRIEDGRGDRLKGELESMAGGRVFTGRRALELGLVDELGGLGEAIAHVAKKAGVDTDSAKLLPEPKSALEGLFAAPEEPADDEIIRMGTRRSPIAAALRATLDETQAAALPQPVRGVLAKVLRRTASCADGKVQLIGPDLRIQLD